MGKHNRCGSPAPSPFVKRCVLDYVKPTLGKDILALDVGSGNNRNLKFLSGVFTSAVGFDQYPEKPAIEFNLKEDVIPISGDLVVCSYVLPFLPEAALPAAVEELCLATLPGGFLVLEFFDAKKVLTPADTCAARASEQLAEKKWIPLLGVGRKHQLWRTVGGPPLKTTMGCVPAKK